MILTQPEAASRDALRYALRELARRAGVPDEELQAWRVEFDPARVILYPDPGSDARVIFAVDPAKSARAAELCRLAPVRYEWMQPPARTILERVPDFRVPFEENGGGGPLFTMCGRADVAARADLLTATLWMLSRMEERHAQDRDRHGRLLARSSISARGGVLERPIVDEYGLAFSQALEVLMPRWRPQRSPLRVKLSHDIDRIGSPRSVRATAALLAKYRNPAAFARDALALAGIGEPVYLRAIDEVARISSERNLDSAFYFKAALRATEHDSGYDVLEPRIRKRIEWLADNGFEVGLHPGYDTFESQDLLEAEVFHLRRLLGQGPIGGRQHYLRWNPSSWLAWERAGLAYDSTLGYAEAIGFRAGTCVPYRPWSLEEERELDLLEIPLLVMDCTPLSYMGLDAEATAERVGSIVERVRTVGGVFTLLWHNASVVEHPYAPVYAKLLDLLGPHQRYDWRAERTR